MKLLFLGDIVGQPGAEIVKNNLNSLIKKYNTDFVIVNGENINSFDGITPKEAEDLFLCGVDVITTGNHAFRQRSIYDYMDDTESIIRPLNFPPLTPGRGYTIKNTSQGSVCVMNFLGQVNVDEVDNPFLMADKLLSKIKADYFFIDFHAEATSEKKAFGYYLDGRVSGIFGTHTHIQTADEQFLDKGTAYITDAGMCGAMNSVLGVTKESAIYKFTTRLHKPYEKATGNPGINGVFVDVENKIIKRINERGQ